MSMCLETGSSKRRTRSEPARWCEGRRCGGAGQLLLHDAEEGLLHKTPRDVPKDQAVLLDQVAVAGAEGGGLTRLVGERHRALDDGRMLGKGEVDQHVAAGSLEHACGG